MNTASIQPAHIMGTPTCSLKRGTNVETAATTPETAAKTGGKVKEEETSYKITVIPQSYETAMQCLSIAPVWIDSQSGYLGKLWIYCL